MKLNVYTKNDLTQNKIDIYCKEKTRDIEQIISFIKDTYDFTITGKLGDATHILNKSLIYYFESVDKKVFAYTKDQTYQIASTISDLDKLLSESGFVRISKSTLLNIRKVSHIKADLNMRTIASLSNNEKIVITRRYKSDFTKALQFLRDRLAGGTYENH